MQEPDASLDFIRKRLAKLVELRLEHGLTESERDEYLDLVALEAQALAERDRQR
jgi:hypothetical protein